MRVRKSLPAVLVSGEDRLSFVNGMGTNALGAGTTDAVETVFTSNIGRCVDLVAAVPYEDVVMLVSSLPSGELYRYLDRYLFPADDVRIEEVAIGQAVEVMGKGVGDVDVGDGMQALPMRFGCMVCKRELGCLTGDGMDDELDEKFGRVIGEDGWEVERIQRGIPKFGVDITGEQNPLESGLWGCVSFDKGCYIGQETIARLNTYGGIKQELRLMEFGGEVRFGDGVFGGAEEGKKSGVVTSVSVKDGRCRALGYLRRKSGLAEVGKEVFVGAERGTVLESPFLRHGFDQRSLLSSK